ncbi:MAG: reactive intermediate/imine deaminase [Candidatus Marinimicrobia bacterium]|nr:reactive intermediate/imine deaminase [Candidatus Neomarinimicrobiota bacterium]|tara:strand:+ start:500 stop:877 length:378 start_codon:yes stop_codon:yes gene_type:complete
MNKTFNTPKAPKAIGPYSQAVISNGFIFTAGQICIIPETNQLNNESFLTEANQVLNNIDTILQEAGSSIANIVKCNVYITDLEKFDIVNEVFKKTFKRNYPARAVVEVSKLPKNVNIEIDVIASI